MEGLMSTADWIQLGILGTMILGGFVTTAVKLTQASNDRVKQQGRIERLDERQGETNARLDALREENHQEHEQVSEKFRTLFSDVSEIKQDVASIKATLAERRK